MCCGATLKTPRSTPPQIHWCPDKASTAHCCCSACPQRWASDAARRHFLLRFIQKASRGLSAPTPCISKDLVSVCAAVSASLPGSICLCSSCFLLDTQKSNVHLQLRDSESRLWSGSLRAPEGPALIKQNCSDAGYFQTVNAHNDVFCCSQSGSVYTAHTRRL